MLPGSKGSIVVTSIKDDNLAVHAYQNSEISDSLLPLEISNEKEGEFRVCYLAKDQENTLNVFRSNAENAIKKLTAKDISSYDRFEDPNKRVENALECVGNYLHEALEAGNKDKQWEYDEKDVYDVSSMMMYGEKAAVLKLMKMTGQTLYDNFVILANKAIDELH